MQRIKNIMSAELIIQLVIFAVVLSVSLINESGTIFMLTVVSMANIALVVSIVYTAHTAIHAQPEQFPFGTGRLENAGAFGCALILLLGASYSLAGSVAQIFNPSIHELPRLDLVSIPVFLSFCANLVMTSILHRSRKKKVVASPVEESVCLAFRLGCIRDAILLVSLLVGIKFGQITHFDPVVTDGLIASIVAIYIIAKAWPILLGNFRVLVDFPLPETEQLAILKVLAQNHDVYQDLGRIYTSRRGKQSVIKIELGFHKGISLDEVLEVEKRFQSELNEVNPESLFHILPFIVELPSSR